MTEWTDKYLNSKTISAKWYTSLGRVDEKMMALQFMNYAFYTHEKLGPWVDRHGSFKAYQHYKKVYTKGTGLGISDMEEAWPKRFGVWVDNNTDYWEPGKRPIQALGYKRRFKTAEFAVNYMEGVWEASQELAKISGQHQNLMRRIALLSKPKNKNWDAIKRDVEEVKKIAEIAEKVLWTTAGYEPYRSPNARAKLDALARVKAGQIGDVAGHILKIHDILNLYAQKRRIGIAPEEAAAMTGLQLLLGTLPILGPVYAGSIDMGVNIVRNVKKIWGDAAEKPWDAMYKP